MSTMRLGDRVLAECRGLLDWLLPPACPLCRTLLASHDPDGLCTACSAGIVPITSPHCPTCLLPYPAPDGPDHPCGACLDDPPPFTVLGVVGQHEGALREAIHRFKYRQGLALNRPLAERLAEAAQEQVRRLAPEAVLPVPLHRVRLRERGYNQSLLLARHLGRRWGLPVLTRQLLRTGSTLPQQGLDAAARRRNLKGSFSLAQPLTARRVLLVDDVMTTGATLRACSEVLRSAGVEQVGAVVLARAGGR